MKVLLVGNGGREHALARALVRTSDTTNPVDLVVQAGNPGIDPLGHPVPFDALDPAAVADLATRENADLVVIGPEAPLAAGVADAVRAAGIPVFGPSRAAAQLEASKSFAKQAMNRAGVATARSHTCTTMEQVDAALDDLGAPHVVKDDALAAGKGVVVTADREAAREHARACVEREGGAVVIEDYLDGPEVSLFCLCDGTDVIPLVPAQDFKRLLDANEGPNTGGMGAYSPLPWLREDLVAEVVAEVAVPTVRHMAERGTPFVGLLYCGLALTSKGTRVVEFNVRFGDPETQVVLERLDSSLAQLLHAAATGTLAQVPAPTWSSDAAVTVVMASAGYPGTLRTGEEITGVDQAEGLPGVTVIHAGTKTRLIGTEGAGEGNCCGVEPEEILVNSGGRVLDVTARAATVEAARAAAYEGVDLIHFDGAQYRRDIATWPARLQA
ncbi:phosphoribosylamine--glycine ligase [Schaalia sp. 19OD2882]|uniref:phosphoribosylamine--glycine ligase n=1 Tax=Schaalia sp. 19OD2882 TaxID=2794089 RepID=UPI001C1EDA33|nr:phosphoribosylamine--glycine ligase [Schaalia sp. 19OD2882]QWW19383.1 phosphoribosylamine--glycine ligase [Schaalia sp. 19OD2882]